MTTIIKMFSSKQRNKKKKKENEQTTIEARLDRSSFGFGVIQKNSPRTQQY